jgi:hypothetical protein
MYRHGKGFDQRSLLKRDVLGELMDPILVRDKIGRNSPLAYSVLKTDIRAEAIFAPPTEKALATDDDRFDHNPVPFLYLRHVSPNFQNLSGDFMANRHWERGRRVLSLEDVEITSADRGGFDLYENTATLKVRQFSLSIFYSPGGGNKGHWIGFFHLSILS